MAGLVAAARVVARVRLRAAVAISEGARVAADRAVAMVAGKAVRTPLESRWWHRSDS